MIEGGVLESCSRDGFAQRIEQFLVDDFYDLLPRREALQHFRADASLFDAGHKVLDDLEVYVCFKQR